MTILTRFLKTSLLFLGIVLLSACDGGEGSSSDNSTAPVARVEIQQTGLVLNDITASKQLSAVAYDGQGSEVRAPIQWSSTQTAISVDANGKVTATTDNGSSQIIASAEGIKSAPLIALVTTFPADAVLLTDAQIVGEPMETDPAAAPSFDNTYQVVLTGVTAPAIGALLIDTESKAVGGQVVASAPTNRDIWTI